jgi:type II secretory pathway component PulF
LFCFQVQSFEDAGDDDEPKFMMKTPLMRELVKKVQFDHFSKDSLNFIKSVIGLVKSFFFDIREIC